jgi:hypothetical protein
MSFIVNPGELFINIINILARTDLYPEDRIDRPQFPFNRSFPSWLQIEGRTSGLELPSGLFSVSASIRWVELYSKKGI